MTRWKGHEQMKEAERNERKALPPRHKNDFAAMQLETILRKHCNIIKSTMHIWGERAMGFGMEYRVGLLANTIW